MKAVEKRAGQSRLTLPGHQLNECYGRKSRYEPRAMRLNQTVETENIGRYCGLFRIQRSALPSDRDHVKTILLILHGKRVDRNKLIIRGLKASRALPEYTR